MLTPAPAPAPSKSPPRSIADFLREERMKREQQLRQQKTVLDVLKERK